MREKAGYIGTCFLRIEKPFTVMDRSNGNTGITNESRPSNSLAVDLSNLNKIHAGGLVQNM